MIYSYNMMNADKPYRTEMSNGKNGYQPIHADSGLQTDAEDMTPSEILEAALASCTNMTVRGVLNKRGIPYDEILVDVRMQLVVHIQLLILLARDLMCVSFLTQNFLMSLCSFLCLAYSAFELKYSSLLFFFSTASVPGVIAEKPAFSSSIPNFCFCSS